MKALIIFIILIIVYLSGIFAHGLDIRRKIKNKGYAKILFLDFTVCEYKKGD
jgi:hypothetical protein